MSELKYQNKSSRRWTDWLGGVFAAAMAGVLISGWMFDIQSITFFLVTMLVYGVMMIAFLIWWLTRRRMGMTQRLLITLAALGSGLLTAVLTRKTIQNPMVLVFTGIPILAVVWWIAYFATEPLTKRRALIVAACFIFVWSPFLLIRMTGFQGNLRADLHWRWTPTAEQLYLAERGKNPVNPTTQIATKTLELQPSDWPAFRGPRRDGIVRNLKIATDWQRSPPKLVWRTRVGPAWSSMAVVDGHIFTQEQRGDKEAVVCRDASTGNEIWSHEDAVRFEESMSGIGPRATPAFDHGRIYAQGTLGALNCLDAGTGKLIWTRDVQKDTEAGFPIWGFCSSPLVIGDRLIQFTSGEGKKGLVAYNTSDGQLLWTADTGKMTYSSPQKFDAEGGPFVLMLANEGFCCVNPQDGKTRWQHLFKQAMGLPAALQPCLVAPTSLVIGNGAAFGAERLELSSPDAAPAEKWSTIRVKPAFSDMVYHDGFIYGFDKTTFCCVDASTGERKWREGNYGAGQVILIEDSGVMIVSTEDGQAILLKCNPQKSEELGRIQAVSGKAWNHQAVAGGRLYIRSDAEMACFDLAAK